MSARHVLFGLNDEQLDSALRIWCASRLSAIDLRRWRIPFGDTLREYRLPASAWLFVRSKSATISVNHNSFKIERCALLHAGKGMLVSARETASSLDIHLLLYSAKAPSANKQEWEQGLNEFNPFDRQFGLLPSEPLLFDQLFNELEQHWHPTARARELLGRSILTRLFYQVHYELTQKKAEPPKIDLAEQAIQYMHARYRSNLTITELQQFLHVSSTQLIRLMKARTGKAPQDYLKHVRLNAARNLLKTSNFSLKEIAQDTGFYDEYHLSHMFKAKFGETPIAYRRNLTFQRRNSYIDYDYQYLYNVLSLADKQELREGVEKLMRHHTLIKGTLATALGLVLLAACSSNAPESASSTTQSASPPAIGEPAALETRTVQTSLGEVEVPLYPQRVIASNMLGDLIALGITPVAASQHESNTVAYQELATPIPTWNEMTPERIVSFEPDLILVFSQEQHDTLSKIAPTVLFPFFELSAEDRILALGEVLNRQSEAQQVVNEYKKRTAAAKERLGQGEQAFEGKTISILEFSWGGLYVYGDSFGRGGDIIYNELGLRAPEVIQNDIIAGEQWRELSLEVVNDYAGDYVLLSGDSAELEEFVKNPVWLSIPAVQNDKVILLDFDLFYHNDIYSLNKQIDFLVEQLLEKAGVAP